MTIHLSFNPLAKKAKEVRSYFSISVSVEHRTVKMINVSIVLSDHVHKLSFDDPNDFVPNIHIDFADTTSNWIFTVLTVASLLVVNISVLVILNLKVVITS